MPPALSSSSASSSSSSASSSSAPPPPASSPFVAESRSSWSATPSACSSSSPLNLFDTHAESNQQGEEDYEDEDVTGEAAPLVTNRYQSSNWWSFLSWPMASSGDHYARLPSTGKSSRAPLSRTHIAMDDLEKLSFRSSRSTNPSAYQPLGSRSGSRTSNHQAWHWARSTFRRHCKLIVSVALVLGLFLWGLLFQLFRPPPYKLIQPRVYRQVLHDFAVDQRLLPSTNTLQPHAWNGAIERHFHTMSKRLQQRHHQLRCAKAKRTKMVRVPLDPDQPPTSIPATMFSSDHTAPPAEELHQWEDLWKSFGFDPVFLDEDAADAFVKKHFGLLNDSHGVNLQANPVVQRRGTPGTLQGDPAAQTATQHAWQALPRGVLRADFLRYILLLTHGGTWADMDVTPLGQRSKWTEPDFRWIPVPDSQHPSPSTTALPTESCPTNASSFPPNSEPIRLVVGLECEPWEYMGHNARGWVEFVRWLPMNRHRTVQFTQWGLHGEMGHPVLIDVLRRLLLADQTYAAHKANLSPDTTTTTITKQYNPWTSVSAGHKWQKADRVRGEKWDDEYPTGWTTWNLWPWNWSWPRWGWHPLSVEEWTGPAVWTDAVFSYLHAISGLRPHDLYGLEGPVQVADVLIAPVTWFHPPHVPSDEARILHNFRGSWKHGADTLFNRTTSQQSGR